MYTQYTPRRTPGKGVKLGDYESDRHSYRIPVNQTGAPPATPQKQVRRDNKQQPQYPPTPVSPPARIYPKLEELGAGFTAFTPSPAPRPAPSKVKAEPKDDPFRGPRQSKSTIPAGFSIAETPIRNSRATKTLKPEDFGDDFKPIPPSAPRPTATNPRSKVPTNAKAKTESTPPSPAPQPTTSKVPPQSSEAKAEPPIPPTPGLSDGSWQNLFTNPTNKDGSSTPLLPEIPGLKKHVKLYPHQITGIKWMTERENPSLGRFGGLNADVMGAGKTLQAITVIAYPRLDHAELKKRCSAPTLVVCPASLVLQWMKLIRDFSHLQCYAYHGPKRSLKDIEPYDVIVTSYMTLLNEYKTFLNTPVNLRQDHAMYGRKWLRVFLDESQYIKNPASKTGAAIYALDTVFRWCLTGTPVQNSVLDLFPLFRFLQFSPFDDRAHFNEEIYRPLKRVPNHETAIRLLRDALQLLMIRRHKDILILPPRAVQIIRCVFSKIEREFYDALSEWATQLIELLIKLARYEGKEFYHSVFVMLLRLRQACSHPELVLKGGMVDLDKTLKPEKTTESYDEDTNTNTGGDDDFEMISEDELDTEKCQICQAPLTTAAETYCTNCSGDAILGRLGKMRGKPSAKMRTLLKIIYDIPKQDKIAVFSQWTSMLDLVGTMLKKAGIRYVQYRGKMTFEQRQEALETIEKDQNVRVILVSLMGGGTGLNLTACNHLVLLDSWWNPAVEEQAFDRIHRIGQHKPVFIHKLLIESPTVEDRIQQIQEKKRQLAENILSKEGAKSAATLSIRELLGFFPDLSKRAVNKVVTHK